MTTVPADTLATTPAPRSRGWLWIVGILLLVGAGSLIWYYNVGDRSQQRPAGGIRRRPRPVRPAGIDARPRRRRRQAQHRRPAEGARDGHAAQHGDGAAPPQRRAGEGATSPKGSAWRKTRCWPKSTPARTRSALNQMLGQQRENEARLKNAQADLETYQRLYKEQLITRQQVTSQEALVAQLQGAIQSNEAQVTNAQAEPGLHEGARADRRPAGTASGRRRQPGEQQRRERPGRHHADAADFGHLHRAGNRSAGRAQGDARRRDG